jgi:sugar lactone lactonase YvrE
MKYIFSITIILLVGLTACGPASAQVTATAALSATATPIPTFISSPTIAPTSTPTLLPLNLTNPTLVVLAENLPGPDDLILAPDGSLYISDVTDGAVKRLTSDGQLQLILSGLNEPEGMILLPDGSLVIAEQGRNRLVRYDPQTNLVTSLLDLPNTTGRDGVDGIALDAKTSNMLTIIVPDSPNGNVLRVGIDGQNETVIARGFARPTGAWVEPDGSILVVDENANSLSRIRPDGTIEKIADLPIPDDVIEDDRGNIFVNTLGDGAIHVISAAGQDSILVSGLSNPQGLIFDADGNLVVTDPGHHRIVKLVIH